MLPYSLGVASATSTTYHSGELTLRKDGTWQLVIETTGPLGRSWDTEAGGYTTSGLNITFIRDKCSDIPHLGTVEGTELRLVYQMGCDVTPDLAMMFRK